MEEKKEKTTQRDCCVAVSTPAGRGAVAIVRLSGKGAKEIAEKLFRPFPAAPNFLQVGTLQAEGFCDNAMCVYFDAPKSYTGEDMVEFHVHGGTRVAAGVAQTCVRFGCRAAQNGEFTKRAFLNGKKNLTQAEGLLDIIDAESTCEIQNGFQMLSGKLDERLETLSDGITDLIAEINAALDYPEEDLELPAKEKIKIRAKQLLTQTEELLSTASKGKLVKNGIDVVLAGRVNAGKSSLLNALVGFDRAIVTNVPGTTRDTLSQSAEYCGVKINYTDTAGIRKTADEIEQLGVDRAKNAIKSADIVLLVRDCADLENEKEFAEIAKNERTVTVYNKIDKCPDVRFTDGIAVSALTGENLDILQDEILKKVQLKGIAPKDILLTNTRQIDCLTRAAAALKNALRELDFTTPDCIAVMLEQAWSAFGEAAGKTVTQAVTDRIFEKFCVGK